MKQPSIFAIMKTVLIITYYWPPSGGSGVQRWLKFANYLEEKGWHCIILTPANPQFEMQDASLEAEVNDQIEVLRIPIWEPYQLFRKIGGHSQPKQGATGISSLARFIRGNFFIPDPRIFWRKPAVRFLMEFLKNRKIDWIITTGPPHSMHLIGLDIKRKLKIPWLADFRDPWAEWDMLDQFKVTNPVRSRHRSLEKKTVLNADIVLTVSDTWGKELSEKYNRHVNVITNGFDTKDFRVTEGNAIPNVFRLAHFGLINGFRYAPAFWTAVSELCSENEEFSRLLRIDLYGVVDENVRMNLHKLDFPDGALHMHGVISHEEVLRSYHQTAVLLMFMNKSDNASGHIPGKLFEYLATGKPVMALGQSSGDAASILSETGAGIVLDWDDRTSIKNTLLNLFHQYKEGTLKGGNPQRLEKYSRETLTEELIQLLDAKTRTIYSIF